MDLKMRPGKPIPNTVPVIVHAGEYVLTPQQMAELRDAKKGDDDETR